METIIQKRFKYLPQTTIGEILINGRHFCYTLEDTVRAYGIKVDGHTAIPANDNSGYNVGIRYSPSFKRNMIVLYTEDDKETLDFGGISFKYIMAHGGNKHEDTQGCILVAYNQDKDIIWGTAERELFDIIKEWLDNDIEVKWIITNS